MLRAQTSVCVRCEQCDRDVKGPATCKADPSQRRIDELVTLANADLPRGCPLPILRNKAQVQLIDEKYDPTVDVDVPCCSPPPVD